MSEHRQTAPSRAASNFVAPVRVQIPRCGHARQAVRGVPATPLGRMPGAGAPYLTPCPADLGSDLEHSASARVRAVQPSSLDAVSSMHPISEEIAEVPRQQHGLLEEDLPVGDAERTIHASQEVPPRADPRILFRAESRPVDVKVRFDL